MAKDIKFESDARGALAAGVSKLASTVAVTVITNSVLYSQTPLWAVTL